MSKSKLLSSSRILVILIAVLFIFQSPGIAGGFLSEQAVELVFLPVVSQSYVYVAPEGDSIIEGVITSRRSGQLIDNTEVCLNGNEICEHSNINGEYILAEVPPGEYTLTALHPNYELFSDEIKILADTPELIDIELDLLLQDGQFRVELTWDSAPTTPPPYNLPNNLDLHLWLRDSGDHHVYEGDKGVCVDALDVFPYACYESDVLDGAGPDILVFAEESGHEYSIGVLNYYDGWEGVLPITDLAAVVEVYDSGGLRIRYTIDEVKDQIGDLWYVFDLSLDEIDRQGCLQQYDNQYGSPPVPCPGR